MARKPSPDNPTCPHCGAAHVVRNGSKDGRPRWVCRQCRRSFGPTYGTPMYRLRTPPRRSGTHVAHCDAPGEPQCRRGNLRPQIRNHRTMASGGRPARPGHYRGSGPGPPSHRGGGGCFLVICKKSAQTLESQQARRAGWALGGDV